MSVSFLVSCGQLSHWQSYHIFFFRCPCSLVCYMSYILMYMSLSAVCLGIFFVFYCWLCFDFEFHLSLYLFRHISLAWMVMSVFLYWWNIYVVRHMFSSLIFFFIISVFSDCFVVICIEFSSSVITW